jgi:hypothetical protein
MSRRLLLGLGLGALGGLALFAWALALDDAREREYMQLEARATARRWMEARAAARRARAD